MPPKHWSHSFVYAGARIRASNVCDIDNCFCLVERPFVGRGGLCAKSSVKLITTDAQQQVHQQSAQFNYQYCKQSWLVAALFRLHNVQCGWLMVYSTSKVLLSSDSEDVVRCMAVTMCVKSAYSRTLHIHCIFINVAYSLHIHGRCIFTDVNGHVIISGY